MSARKRLDPRVDSCFFGGFKELRPAQEQAIAPLLEGRDVILCSGTGTGKTEAALAPLLSRYWRLAVKEDCLVVLFVTPTKALANDLKRRLDTPLQGLGLRSGIRHGDQDDLAHAASIHVLITTPESLDVLLHRKDSALSTVRAVIIDEVHLLYNTQRGLQLSIALRRLQTRVACPLQRVALSATIGRLGDVWQFLFGANAVVVQISAKTERTIDAKIYPGEMLIDVVTRLSDEPRKLLIFANARHACEKLVSALKDVPMLRECVFAHYSSLSPEVRTKTEQDFGRLERAICVATSTLELGIDIGDIHAVLLWGMPGSVESFLQRIGRGNRRYHKSNVFCFIPPEVQDRGTEALLFLTIIEAGKQGIIPQRSPFQLYGAIAQQCLIAIHAADEYSVRLLDLVEMLNHLAYLDRDSLTSILDALVDHGYLGKHGFKNRYCPGEKLHELVYRRRIYGNFPEGSRTVKLFHGRKELGDVPADNEKKIERGSIVRFAGRYWHVVAKRYDRIEMEPAKTSVAAIDFQYGGVGMTLDAFLLDRLWKLVHTGNIPFESISKQLREISVATSNRILLSKSPDAIPPHVATKSYRYVTFAGKLINHVIVLWAHQANAQVDDFAIISSAPIDWPALPTEPKEFLPVLDRACELLLDQTIYQKILPGALQKHERQQTWLADDTVRAVLERLQSSTVA